MTRYKATINIDRDKWDEFKQICEAQGSNASEEIRKVIDFFVLGKNLHNKVLLGDQPLPYFLQEMKDEVVALAVAQIESEIGAYKHEMIARFDHLSKQIYELESSAEGKEKQKAPQTPTKAKVKKPEGKNPQLKAEIKPQPPDKAPDSDIPEPQASDHPLPAKHKARKKKKLPFDLPPGVELFSDKEIAEKTGASYQQVNRWRKTKKIPPMWKKELDNYNPTKEGWLYPYRSLSLADSERLQPLLGTGAWIPEERVVWTDKEVATREGRKTKQITSYREGKSNCRKAGFYERWQVSPCGMGWIEIG